MGSTCCIFSCVTDEALSGPASSQPMCVDVRDGRDGQEVLDSQPIPSDFNDIICPKLSIQCLDNPEGEDGVVVFASESFPIHPNKMVL